MLFMSRTKLLLLYCTLIIGFTSYAEIPKRMPNKLGNFKGVSLHEAYQGHTWVAAPYLKGPASIDIDPKGRVFVSEARRMGKGCPIIVGSTGEFTRIIDSKRSRID